MAEMPVAAPRHPRHLALCRRRIRSSRALTRVIRLASNESALGPSPRAIAAYRAQAEELHRYPDGGSVGLREAIGRRYGLDAQRIVCGTGSDELISLLARAYAGPGDEVIYSRHGFLMYPIAAQSAGRDAGGGAGAAPHRRCRRHPGAGHARHAARLPRQSQQSHRHLPAARGGAAAACRAAALDAAGDRRGLCRVRRAQRLRAGHRAGRERRRTSSCCAPSRRSTRWRRCASAGPMAAPPSPTC